jgi:chromosome segregation ATPase
MPDLENESQLAVALTELTSKIETLIDKQDELAENISKIKEAVYNPDEGLYARLNRLDARLLGLESWKSNNAKILWIVISVGLGLIITTAWKAIL